MKRRIKMFLVKRKLAKYVNGCVEAYYSEYLGLIGFDIWFNGDYHRFTMSLPVFMYSKIKAIVKRAILEVF